MKQIIFLVFMVVSTQVTAGGFFEEADLKDGQKLVEKNCVSCHASNYGGDGTKIYTRETHKVKSPEALVSQVRNCSTNLSLRWFDEEEFNAAAYLNKHYYKFE